MVIEEIRAIKSGRRDLRSFGLVVGSAFLALAAVLLWRHRPLGLPLALIGGSLIVLGLSFPGFLKPLQKGWMTLAVLMGWFMTRVILSLLFFFVLTPIGLAARILGKPFLDRKPVDAGNSCWRRRPPASGGPERYEKQF